MSGAIIGDSNSTEWFSYNTFCNIAVSQSDIIQGHSSSPRSVHFHQTSKPAERGPFCHQVSLRSPGNLACPLMQWDACVASCTDTTRLSCSQDKGLLHTFTCNYFPFQRYQFLYCNLETVTFLHFYLPATHVLMQTLAKPKVIISFLALHTSKKYTTV